MIRIHFDNKDVVEVETTLEEYLDLMSKIRNTKYNAVIFNNQVVANFDKIVYVEKIEVEK